MGNNSPTTASQEGTRWRISAASCSSAPSKASPIAGPESAASRRGSAAATGSTARVAANGRTQMWCRRSLIGASTLPWSHQDAAADFAHDGRHVVLSTGTASGKSLAYQLPILTAMKADSRARALYLSPTKALGHDQLRAAVALTDAVPALRDVAPSSYDGDSPADVRRFARERSRWIFSNPDMIHLSLLRNHARWAVFLRNLRYVVSRRMPLLPRHFRIKRGDGAAPAAAAVQPVSRRSARCPR